MKLGNIEDEIINIEIEVVKTKLNINKIDYDTKNIYPQGEASLNNATIGIYDEKMTYIKEYLVENNQIIIENLNFGKYYLKEIKPGIGYNLNTNIYEININKNNINQTLNIENKVIKKKIIIKKKYGELNNLNNEPNIQFKIYDKNKNMIKIIETNKQGVAEIELPYGKYTIIQLNTTTGYQKIEPFNIEIKNNEDEIIELTDYKIKVPNTSKNKKTFFSTILIILLNILI